MFKSMDESECIAFLSRGRSELVGGDPLDDGCAETSEIEPDLLSSGCGGGSEEGTFGFRWVTRFSNSEHQHSDESLPSSDAASPRKDDRGEDQRV